MQKLGVRNKDYSVEVCRFKFDLLDYIHMWLFLQHSSEGSKANTTKPSEGKTKIQS